MFTSIALRLNNMVGSLLNQKPNKSFCVGWYGIIAILICAGVSLTSMGCNSAKAADISSVKFTISASVNWDDDPEPDGVQFIIRPQADNGLIINDTCAVNARLWLQQKEGSGEKEKLIQEWNQVKITRNDYVENLGARVRLEYDVYTPLPQDNGVLWLEVTTSDGRTVSFEEANIRLKYYNLPELKQQSGCCP